MDKQNDVTFQRRKKENNVNITPPYSILSNIEKITIVIKIDLEGSTSSINIVEKIEYTLNCSSRITPL